MLAGGQRHESRTDGTFVGANKQIAPAGHHCSWRCRGPAFLAEARSYHPEAEVWQMSSLFSFKSFIFLFFSPQVTWVSLFFFLKKKPPYYKVLFFYSVKTFFTATARITSP